MLRKNMTFSEILLWQELQGKKIRGYDFDRQRPIDEYIVDFYCKELQLALEIDGDSHGSIIALKKDKIRQTRLESLGVNFMRFDNRDIKSDLSRVIAKIDDWIEQNEPTPHPSEEGN